MDGLYNSYDDAEEDVDERLLVLEEQARATRDDARYEGQDSAPRRAWGAAWTTLAADHTEVDGGGEGRVNHRGPALRRLGEAYEHIREMFVRQIERAKEARAPPNSLIHGDAEARKKFYALLPPDSQRLLFMEQLIDTREYGRLLGLVGAPPYVFLRQMDMGSLRATGIAHGRVNITYADENHIVNYSQFGEPVFVDTFNRHYNHTLRVYDADIYLGIEGLDAAIAANGAALLVVRIKRTTKSSRTLLLKEQEGRRMLQHPTPGEIITLHHSQFMKNIVLESKRADTVRVKVRSVERAGPRSATARLIVGMA